MQKQQQNILIRVEAFSGEHLLLRVLIFMLSLCICGYLYFVGLSIMNVISNRESTATSESLRSTVGELEQEYFELAKSITPEMAPNLGLSKTDNAVYIKRTPGVASNAQSAI